MGMGQRAKHGAAPQKREKEREKEEEKQLGGPFWEGKEGKGEWREI